MHSDYSYPVNIGNPDEVTILEFAQEIIAITGTQSKVVFEPLPEDDPKVRQPNIELAKKLLGWEPKVHRSEGLKTTIDFFKNKIRNGLQAANN